MQVLLADPHLTQWTLVYQDGNRRGLIWETPWWMMILWAVVIFLLGWWFSYLNFERQLASGFRLFILSGSIFFLAVELLVGNLYRDQLWKRKHCRQYAHVALYAVMAEFFTVLVLAFVFPYVLAGIVFAGAGIVLGMAAGILIAYIFMCFCTMCYGPEKRTE
jgi:hypothetical protein